jgi:hypothetical protein
MNKWSAQSDAQDGKEVRGPSQQEISELIAGLQGQLFLSLIVEQETKHEIR